jgi:hypothetical protein
VLVSNVGVIRFPGRIGAIASGERQAVIAANLLPAVRLDRLLMPGARKGAGVPAMHWHPGRCHLRRRYPGKPWGVPVAWPTSMRWPSGSRI